MRSNRQALKDMARILAERAAGLSAQGLLALVYQTLGEDIAMATSLSPEDQVLTDMLCSVQANPRIFTIDTGRLPQQTYDLIDRTCRHYGIKIRFFLPQAAAVERMVNAYGPNLFYESVQLRRRCCYIRKVEPLRRALKGLKAWICGLRTGQSVTRLNIRPISWDAEHDLIKICPLADWTIRQVWQYIQEHRVPYNQLHDHGYASIGCAPCTRPIQPGEDIRAGRWWWEPPEQKECGLHIAEKIAEKKER